MASDQNIGITLTANSTAAEQAFQKIISLADKVSDKMDGIAQSSEKAAKSTTSGFDQGVTSAMKFASALSGIGTATAGALALAGQLRKEYDNLLQRQKGAEDTTKEFETQLSQAIRNAGSAMTGDEVRKMAVDLSKEVSADPAEVARVLSDAFSAKGVANKADAAIVGQAVKDTFRFAPEMAAADKATLAGTTIDIMKQDKSTSRQAIGLAQMTGNFARTTTLKGLAENLMPAAVMMSQLGGGTVAENAALGSGLSQGIVDPDGAVTRTAGITLVKELRERMPNLKDTDARLKALQSDPKLQKMFLEGGNWRKFGGKQAGAAETGRGQAIASVESLISGQGVAFEEYIKARGAIGDKAAAGVEFDEAVRKVDAATRISRIQRVGSSATSNAQLGDARSAEISAVREAMTKFAQANGDSAMQQMFSGYKFEAGSLAGLNPIDQAIGQLTESARSIRNPVSSAGVGAGPGMPAKAFLTPEQQQRATNLDALAEEFRSLRKSLDQNTEATKANTKDNPSPAPRPISVPSAARSRSN